MVDGSVIIIKFNNNNKKNIIIIIIRRVESKFIIDFEKLISRVRLEMRLASYTNNIDRNLFYVLL